MPDTAKINPPLPANVPPDLTAPSGSYRLRVTLVFGSIAVFVVLYLSLTIGSAFLCYYSFATLGDREPETASSSGSRKTKTAPFKHNPALMIVLGLFSGPLFLFLVKGLFKYRRSDPSLRVEITEKDQPTLFAFIRQLCKETRAPLPHRVFLDPEVNACVFYKSSFLSLFWPTPKNLLIGLGLVNRLNLSEFKAVLAHEFGHFAQTSMKLGSYVYTSNGIIIDIVYARDWLDDLLGWIRSSALRSDSKGAIAASVLGWFFSGCLWLLRLVLAGLYRLINFANSALSRQMEFNADLVAVSVTGSDALVHALARLDFANEALEFAEDELITAGDHKLYTRDLFYHQTTAVKHLRSVRQDPGLGEPPPLPADPKKTSQLFEPEDHSVPLMWASHPTNHDREQNTKRLYIRCPMDQRSSWLLFDDPAAARTQVTRRYYQVAMKIRDPQMSDPREVQKFLDAEQQESTYHERYLGMYDDRYVAPGEVEELVTAAAQAFADANQLAKAMNRLHGQEFKDRMSAHRRREEESELLAGLVSGELKLTTADFAFREARYRPRDAAGLLKKVEAELEADSEWFADLDRQVFLVHHAMARRLGAEVCQELERRYRFHLEVQEILDQLTDCQNETDETLEGIEGQRKLDQVEFLELQQFFLGARETLHEVLEIARPLELPALLGMTAGDSLGTFLLGRPLINKPGWFQSIDGKWIDLFTEQLAEMLDKTRRIHFKSLGGILSLQERIEKAWAGGAVRRPAPSAEPRGSAGSALPS